MEKKIILRRKRKKRNNGMGHCVWMGVGGYGAQSVHAKGSELYLPV